MTEKMTIAEYKAAQVKVSKYKNEKTYYKAEMYDSKREADYAELLDSMRKAKSPAQRVMRYDRQVEYEFVINGVKVCKYFADFKVFYADGHHEVVDVKSDFTKKLPVYRLKKKLMFAVFGIKIVEV